MTHADLPGGWRTNTLQEAVFSNLTIDQALHLVGVRDTGAFAKQAKEALADAVAAYRAGDETNAMATAASLAEEIKQARKPKGAAA